MLNLEKLYITDREEIRKILKLSDYGRLGNYVWKIFNGTNWNKVNSKGGYIISVLARRSGVREADSTGHKLSITCHAGNQQRVIQKTNIVSAGY